MLSNYDQPVRMTQEEMKIFSEVDAVIGRSITIGDPLLAFEFGSHLRRRAFIEGLALAKLLYRMNEGWDLFRAAGIDDDMVTMAHTELGVAPETTKKYIKMWGNIFENEDVDDETKMILMGRQIGDLLLLTAAVGEGNLAGDELREAALTPDRESLREIIRQKRGEHTSSASAIKIILNMVDKPHMPAGTLYAKKGEETEVLAIVYPPKTDFGEQALNRLVNSSGVIELYG